MPACRFTVRWLGFMVARKHVAPCLWWCLDLDDIVSCCWAPGSRPYHLCNAGLLGGGQRQPLPSVCGRCLESDACRSLWRSSRTLRYRICLPLSTRSLGGVCVS